VREPLRHRRFRLLFLAQCASFLGDAMFVVAIAFAVLEVSGSATALGVVFACSSVALVLSFLVSGVWADRLPRLQLMIASDVLRVLTQCSMAALLLTHTATIPRLIALYVIYSVATAFFQPARSGLMPQLLHTDLLVPANGLMSLAENTMSVVGWAAGGLLVAAVGAGGAIAIDAGSFAVSAALLLAIGHVPSTAIEGERESFLRELATGWRELRSHRWLWYTIASVTGWLLLFEAPMQVIGPLTMRNHYGGAVSWGLLGMSLAAGAVVGSVVVSLRLIRRPMLCSLWMFFASAALPLLLLMQAPLAVLMACEALVGASFGLFLAIWESAIQSRIPPDKVARVSAWDWMGSLAGMPIGFAVAGIAIDAFGSTPTLLAMAIASVTVCTLLLLEPTVRALDQPAAGATTGPSGRIVP
jgi:MFS family permease